LLALIIFQGCQYNPYASSFTTEKPQAADVVGVYELKEQTVNRKGLAALNGKLCSIDLRADGRFTARSVPLMMDSPPADFFEKLVSTTGTWRIDPVGGGGSPGRVWTHWGVYLVSKDMSLEPLGLTGKKSPYGLIITLGDPDSGTVMLFKKVR
jgi:hypothetical protein